MTKEKKIWEKPVVQSLSVKGITLGGPSDHSDEQSAPPYKKGWGGSGPVQS